MWVADPLERPGVAFEFGARLATTFTPDVGGEWRFGVESVAPSRLRVDGDVVLDNADVPVGGSFFGTGRAELTASIASKPVGPTNSRSRCASATPGWAWVVSTSDRSHPSPATR